MCLKLSLLNMPGYAWLCLYKRDSKQCQNSEYGRVLNIRALCSVLNMPECALTKF